MKAEFIENYSLEEIERIFEAMGEKPYRAKQLFSWLYEKNVSSFDEMTNFSKKLRSDLAERFVLNALCLEERWVSKIDGTEKYLFRTHDSNFIEGVFIRNDGCDDGRLTVCVSSQVGCAMGCKFCATSRIGFIRDLEVAEILSQLRIIRRMSGLKNNNVVFMGMGEPFMNYDNVLKAADIMNYSFGFHISVRKITISTCGLADKIERFIDEKRPYNLAISMNDTEPHKRKINMPVEKRFPFLEIALLLKRKFPVSRNRVTIEYVMRKDNISHQDVIRIKKLFSFKRIKLNLIPLNSTGVCFDKPDPDDQERFVHELEMFDVPLSIRKSLGSDINGACGQLSGRRYLDAG